MVCVLCGECLLAGQLVEFTLPHGTRILVCDSCAPGCAGVATGLENLRTEAQKVELRQLQEVNRG